MMQHNPYANVPEKMAVTAEAASFIESVEIEDIPGEAIRIGTRCVLDGLGLIVSGSDERAVRILAEDAREQGGRPEALLLGCGDVKVPATIAARILGTSGHAHDWDDSQVSLDPNHLYGLLTHPTIPPLSSALAATQKIGGVSGKAFLLGFLTGFEVECKISEWMLPRHYKAGMHSSGTVGTFGAYAAAARLMGLTGERLRWGFGIAASLAAGIRVNFGTMTKPLHVGRAAENGMTAAILASRGFTAAPDALDGPWGFFAVHGCGVSEDKIKQGFGNTWSIVDPGVSIKPYPCGILTHPTMDLMLRLVTENDIKPEQIDQITVYAASNILNPIRYQVAENHLQAKFCLAAELAMIALNRKAGKIEFSDEFVRSEAMQTMQRKIRTQHDPDIEKLGFDKIRSKIKIDLKDGRSIQGVADERYRGGPDNPMSDAELEEKVRACCAGILDNAEQNKLIETAWSIQDLSDARLLANVIQPGQNLGATS
ncbi:MAG: MmgE/PrpD family protein [Deltaproteobacteria bacterium]|nr:MmgE/PrpD family protein [Deltaproteobacteria bacterium]